MMPRAFSLKPRKTPVIVAILLCSAVAIYERFARASGCTDFSVRLTLKSVTEEDVPISDLSPWKGTVYLHGRTLDHVYITAEPTDARTSFWKETYDATNAPSP